MRKLWTFFDFLLWKWMLIFRSKKSKKVHKLFQISPGYSTATTWVIVTESLKYILFFTSPHPIRFSEKLRKNWNDEMYCKKFYWNARHIVADFLKNQWKANWNMYFNGLFVITCKKNTHVQKNSCLPSFWSGKDKN